MFKMRVALLGAMALLVVSGFAASTASALGPYWKVNGSKLVGTKAINLQLKGTAVLAVPKIPLTVECTNSRSELSAINSNGTRQGQDKGQIKYTGCTVTESPTKGCKVNEPITTNQTKSYLAIAESPTRIVDVFAPEKLTVFVELVFTSCGLITNEPVQGSVAAEVKPENTEVTEGDLQFPKPSIATVKKEGGASQPVELKVGGIVSTFSAGYGAKLVSNEKFGVTEL
jgi:hypothetical protein